MRHERDCTCERCRPASSVSDTFLTGTLTLAGVAFAILWGSKIVVATVVFLTIALAARKIFLPLSGARRRKRGK